MKLKIANSKLLIPLIGYLLILGNFLTSCSSSDSPERLAKECCDCYQEMKSTKNVDARDRKLNECANLQMENQRRLQELGIANDWDETQVNDARNSFEAILDKCPN